MMRASQILRGLAEAEIGVWEQIQQNLGARELVEITATVLIAFILGWLVQRSARRMKHLASATKSDVDDRLVGFIGRFNKGIIAFLTVIIVLRILRLEITPLLAGAGIIGIGVAYAAKDVIGNFLAGLVLLVDQPIRVGDRIQIERIGSQWGSWGDVVDVGLRTTTVRNTDGVLVTYPNAKLSESVIKNFSPKKEAVRFRLRVLVDIHADLPKALEILTAVGQDHPEVLDDPAPTAVVRALYHEEAGSLHQGALLELRCYLADIRRRTRLRSKLFINVLERFREGGIAISHPRLSVER